MITTGFWFIGGCVAGVIGTLTAQKVRTIVKSSQKGASVYKLLTMEHITARASNYLQAHPEIEEIGVVLYGKDNLPPEVSAVLQSKIPEKAQHILLLAAVKNDTNQKIIDICMAGQLEPSLKLALADGIIKIGR